jgi:peptide chain release factor 1
MKPTIAARLAQLANRLEEITRLLGQEDATADLDQYRKLTREHAELSPVVELYRKHASAERDIETAQQMAGDPTMREFAESELRDTRERLSGIERQLQQLLLPRDPNDDRNIFLEIRAGTGGDESGLFAGELFRMYTRHAERNGWQVEVMSQSQSDRGGYKEVIAKVVGRGAYSRLKFESGGHRVQRVPVTETQGRIHTSACTVAVMPEVDEVADVVLNPAELRIDTYRASGAGGQHVNKTESAVRITHLPPASWPNARTTARSTRTGAGDGGARGAHQGQAGARAAGEAGGHAQVPGRQRRPLGAHPHLQLSPGPRHRSPDQSHALQDRRIMDGDLYELISALIAEHQTEQLAQLAEENAAGLNRPASPTRRSGCPFAVTRSAPM